MNDWKEHHHIGYGSNFNVILTKDNILKKKAKNHYGEEKMKYEIEFYKYIIHHNIKFPIPHIYNFTKKCILMKYLKEYVPLYSVFFKQTIDIQESILNMILDKLTILHNSSKLVIDKKTYYNELIYETYDKLLLRYNEYDSIIKKYSNIQYVNGIKVKSFKEIIEYIKNKIIEYIETIDSFILYPIHGDCQFNNIMVLPNLTNILFIDPRGFFGSNKLFGIKEYDIAKIHFALSGYDLFDNSQISQLKIIGNNIEIENINMYDVYFTTPNIITYLVASIWLGNPHCFINNEAKLVTSFFYGLYFGTKYI